MKARYGLFPAGGIAPRALRLQHHVAHGAGRRGARQPAGSAGPDYCETVPSNPDDMEQWNQLCAPGGNR